MTRILKRGQKTYFKEDVVTCLADETMQKVFSQSEYGNRVVFMEELQEEAKERFNMDFTDEDYKSFKTLIAKDEYLLSLDDNAGILESKALDIVVGYGRVKGGVSGLWEKEQAEYDQKEQLYADLLKKHPMKYDAKAECLWLPDGTKVNNVLSPLQAEYYHDNYLYHEVFERMAQMEFENSLKNEVLNQDRCSYMGGDDVSDFNRIDENKRTAIIYEHFVKAYPEFIKNFERIAESVIQQKEMSLENVELPVLHSEKDIPEDVLSTFETYCIKDGVSYAMNETKDELYAINSSLSDHDINTLLKSAINKHEFDAGDQVYLYADDDKLHHHLEELFDQYLDTPEDFDYVSEEFENGLEQYQDEIGKNEMEL